VNLLRTIVFTTAALISTGIHAQRQPVPIVNHENMAVVTRSGNAVTAEQVKKAIMDGAVAGKRRWDIAHTAAGKVQATYRVRTHTIVTEIENTATTYSIRYVSSINMKYEVAQPSQQFSTTSPAISYKEGTPLIHPFYNTWVQELIEAIRGEMLKL